jgi:MoxR-like ATPase
LVLGGKARSLLHGRGYVTVEDVQALSPPVLRHRLVINFAADSEGITPDDVIARVLESIPTREDELTRDPRFRQMLAS